MFIKPVSYFRQASGSPKPVLYWRKDHGELYATERHFFTADNQLLIIVKVFVPSLSFVFRPFSILFFVPSLDPFSCPFLSILHSCPFCFFLLPFLSFFLSLLCPLFFVFTLYSFFVPTFCPSFVCVPALSSFVFLLCAFVPHHCQGLVGFVPSLTFCFSSLLCPLFLSFSYPLFCPCLCHFVALSFTLSIDPAAILLYTLS